MQLIKGGLFRFSETDSATFTLDPNWKNNLPLEVGADEKEMESLAVVPRVNIF